MIFLPYETEPLGMRYREVLKEIVKTGGGRLGEGNDFDQKNNSPFG
jgi:hypothetical protein